MTTPRTPATPAERLEAVYTMLVRGATEEQTLAAAAEWGATQEEAVGYHAAALARFRKLSDVLADVERGKALAQLLDLYARCIKNTDYARALAVRKEMSTVLGIGAPTTKPPKPAHDPLADEIEKLEKELNVS